MQELSTNYTGHVYYRLLVLHHGRPLTEFARKAPTPTLKCLLLGKTCWSPKHVSSDLVENACMLRQEKMFW